MLAACSLATRDVQTADPFTDERRSAMIFASIKLPCRVALPCRRPRCDTLLTLRHAVCMSECGVHLIDAG